MRQWGDGPVSETAGGSRDRAIWRLTTVLSGIAMLAAPAVVGCVWYFGRGLPPPPPRARTLVLTEPAARRLEQLPPVMFREVAREAGLVFRHENGARGECLMPETYGGGCAFCDFDGDGDQDVLLVNSDDHLPDAPDASPQRRPTCKLFRNDGTGSFDDVTSGSGLDITLYGMGAAVGDVNGDGLPDVYISAVGENRLFQNLGQFKFTDVTHQAGVAGDQEDWSTSCAVFDYDRDGDLDLFVGNYVSWSRDVDLALDRRFAGVPNYSGPPSWKGSFCRLYRNDSDFQFTDVSEESGIRVLRRETGYPAAKALGLRPLDANHDGWLDLIVANDQVPQFLLINQRNGTFLQVGEQRGIAHDRNGLAIAGMGIDVCHYRNDGDRIVAIANFFANGLTVFQFDEGAEQFNDVAPHFGIVDATLPMTSFGLLFFDYDLDGREDLLLANGSVQTEQAAQLFGENYRMPTQLFWNSGEGTFPQMMRAPEEICGRELRQPIIGRGAAYADIDSDGDLDILIMENGGPALLFRNEQQTGNHWLRIQLIGQADNFEAIGAAVSVQAGEETMHRDVMPTRSYLSQVELPVTFGLGRNERIDAMWIIWPDGVRQDVNVANIKIDAANVIQRE